jgi:hypothetical protein
VYFKFLPVIALAAGKNSNKSTEVLLLARRCRQICTAISLTIFVVRVGYLHLTSV